MSIAEFHYKIPWRSRRSYPGYHRSSLNIGGFEFRDFANLLDAPDPRRFDIRASARDPFEQIKVRVYNQRSAITVYAIVDLSASMGFMHKLDVLADFIASLGYSTYRTGDSFGLIGCDTSARYDFLHHPSHRKNTGLTLARKLRAFRPVGTHARGLLDAAGLLPMRRGLVFLASDFHFPLKLVDQILASLAQHQVVPMVFWDRTEFEDLPRFGIAQIRDAETGQQRSLLLRPSLRDKIRQSFRERREKLEQCFLSWGSPPLFVINGFNPDAVTRYFHG